MPTCVSHVRLNMPRADLRPLRWLFFFITVSLLVTADQFSKAWIRTYPEGSVIFQQGFLRIVHIENSGAAFGMFQGFSSVLLIFDFIALAGILVYLLFFRQRFPFPGFKTSWVALTLIFTGTLGNLIDRLNSSVNGITDFLYLGPWPAFNVADSCITVGVLLLVFSLLFIKEKREIKRE
jgi:signal peptidase II